MHVFSLCKTRSNAAMRFCTCHGAGNVIETLHNLVRNIISGLIFIWPFNYLFKQVFFEFYPFRIASMSTYYPDFVKLRYCCIKAKKLTSLNVWLNRY